MDPMSAHACKTRAREDAELTSAWIQPKTSENIPLPTSALTTKSLRDMSHDACILTRGARHDAHGLVPEECCCC